VVQAVGVCKREYIEGRLQQHRKGSHMMVAPHRSYRHDNVLDQCVDLLCAQIFKACLYLSPLCMDGRHYCVQRMLRAKGIDC
jgi:hypothetical protein